MSRDICDYDAMSSCHHECDPCGPLDSRDNHMGETEDAMALDHIGELPEVRRYLDDGKQNFMLHGGFGIRYIRESIADAALAAADQYASSMDVRRCEGCEHVRHHAVGKPHAYRLCSLGNSFGYDAALPDDFACNRWAERSTP